MNEEISPVAVRAVTVTIEVMSVPELVMKALLPLSTHSSVAASKTRPGAGATGVAAGVGFGEAEGTEAAPGDEVGQPLGLLLGGAEGVDRVGAKPDAGRQGDAQALAHLPDLLDRDAQGGEVAAAATPLGLEDQPEQAEVGHLRHRVEGQHAGGFPRVDVGGELPSGEVAHDRAERIVFIAEVEHFLPPRQLNERSA